MILHTWHHAEYFVIFIWLSDTHQVNAQVNAHQIHKFFLERKPYSYREISATEMLNYNKYLHTWNNLIYLNTRFKWNRRRNDTVIHQTAEETWWQLEHGKTVLTRYKNTLTLWQQQTTLDKHARQPALINCALTDFALCEHLPNLKTRWMMHQLISDVFDVKSFLTCNLTDVCYIATRWRSTDRPRSRLWINIYKSLLIRVRRGGGEEDSENRE